ncbi:MAG: hypothetical protein ACR2PL_02790 [Dehalococcoidia bacterium]
MAFVLLLLLARREAEYLQRVFGEASVISPKTPLESYGRDAWWLKKRCNETISVGPVISASGAK